ncbi:MAG: dihydrodipicolinate synthase family protein [bacterium]|nr:dihydrodipicolinate synthase family protein [bacterium]MDE0290338.1 dihydrodipicolinate synthase family protein [bacterium]MDE0439845.1 dihydrodipicolinate synthase family protein [bacterium]
MIDSMPTSGLVAIAVTPLDGGGNIDLPGISTLMDFYISCGSSGLALLGVMGEANRMTDREARLVVEETMVSIDGRVPVIVGVSDSSLTRVRSLATFAMDSGAAGVLLQPLAGLAGDERVAGYFEVATATLGDIPICVQDFPKANGVHISPNTWRLIVERCPTVTMLKAEDEPGLGKLTAIRRAEAAGQRRVTILTGNNGIHLVQELMRGSDGAMTGFAFPDVLARVIALHAAGRVDEAEDLYDKYLPINRHEFRMGIGVRKEVLRRRKAIGTARARFPASTLSRFDLEEIDRFLLRLEAVTGLLTTDIVR